ncbi:MAG: DinB family protein [Cytophagales bacterium]|nr:DinB family protein [Cytophagales bacterium]
MGILTASQKLLSQLQDSLSQLSNEEFKLPLAIFSGSSIGQHTRHTLEFYICLLAQVNVGCVNYDLRQRDLRLENDKSFTLDTIDSLIQQLESLDLSQQITLEATLGGKLNTLSSNVGRELLYATEHTVHHMAIIKMGFAQHFPTVSLCEGFGVAESTITYQQACAQ